MKNKVIKYIESNNLISSGDKIVIGVSGGADSMCLFHILKSLKDSYDLGLVVAHVNHGVRDQAKEDALYVQSVCEKWGIDFKGHSFNMTELAKDKNCSEEEAGRSERYRFFEKVRKEFKADKIATAHSMNDQAETMLMRIIRGSGLTGLGGIRAKRNNIIRPILILTREEVEAYCKKNNIKYKEDLTNKMDIYTRNKLRLKVLPILRKEFNPNVIQNMHNLSVQLQETEDYLQEQTKQAYKLLVSDYKNGYSIDIEKLLEYHQTIQKRLVRKTIGQKKGDLKNITNTHITSVLELASRQSGKRVDIIDGIVGIREFSALRILKEEENIETKQDLALGDNFIKESNKKISLSLESNGENIQRLKNTYTKNIDYDKISGNLQVRNRKAGDEIVLASGRKKLKDFFIDEKIPKTSRDDILLIADDNNIIWIVGYRLSELYYITDKTKKVLKMQVSKFET